MLKKSDEKKKLFTCLVLCYKCTICTNNVKCEHGTEDEWRKYCRAFHPYILSSEQFCSAANKSEFFCLFLFIFPQHNNYTVDNSADPMKCGFTKAKHQNETGAFRN